MQRKRILIVDDSDSLRAALRLVLETAGYDVFEADNGRAALNAARRHHPHAVILALEIPALNGRQTVSALRQDFRTADLPVVAITARDDFLRSEAVEAGFSALLRMPFTPEVLLQVLASLTRDAPYEVISAGGPREFPGILQAA